MLFLSTFRTSLLPRRKKLQLDFVSLCEQGPLKYFPDSLFKIQEKRGFFFPLIFHLYFLLSSKRLKRVHSNSSSKKDATVLILTKSQDLGRSPKRWTATLRCNKIVFCTILLEGHSRRWRNGHLASFPLLCFIVT